MHRDPLLQVFPFRQLHGRAQIARALECQLVASRLGPAPQRIEGYITDQSCLGVLLQLPLFCAFRHPFRLECWCDQCMLGQVVSGSSVS